LTLQLPSGAALRPVAEDDAEELHAMIELNRQELARWLHWAADQTLDGTREYTRRARENAQDGTGLECAIVARGRIVGAVGLPAVSRVNGSAVIGYWLDREHRGRGLMTEAVRAVVGHAFGQMDLHRLEIHAALENAASRAIAERLGFRQEGTLREAYRVAPDRWLDEALYALLVSDTRV
jgi:ribosomal-protein-serine acetyltransferase